MKMTISRCSAARVSAIGFLAGGLIIGLSTAAADWPMFGRDARRNAVSPERNPPIRWDVTTGRNIEWKARIGNYTFATPVVANGLVWVGTNNENPRDPAIQGPAGVLMCFRESDGQFLYQHVSPARQGPTFHQAHTGVASSPLIEDERLWFVTTGQEVVCLDVGPLQRGEGLPKQLWKLDMMDELGVYARRAVMGGGNLCSITSHGDRIYVTTGNGTAWNEKDVPSPFAPALLCLNKNTGAMVWEDHSSGAGILFAEWGNPLVIDVNGRAQVIAPQGDGWVRSFDAMTGELIWKFDINAKSAKWPQTRGFFSTAPVFAENRVYIAIGNYIEFGEMPSGRLVCLDPTKEGDISLELEDGPGKGKPNPNSGAAWHFDGIARTMSNVAVHDGVVIAPDFAGFVYCLDAGTGQTHWKHDMKAHVLNSPLVADGKIYVGDEDGELAVLALSREKQVLAENAFEGPILSAPIFANERLYVVAGDTLFAIKNDAGTDWPQWRGPDRSNASRETGLLASWPEGGPPRLWSLSGLGVGIHSVSVAGGRIYTTGNVDGTEMLFAVDARSADTVWARRLGPTIRENALMRWLSQRSPTVDDDRIYTLTMQGELQCLRARDGEVLWRRNYPEEFGNRRPIWGYCDIPLIDGDKIICTPFGTNAFITALDKRTGKTVWQTTVESLPRAGYAALMPSEACGVRQYVVFHSRGLSSFAAADGKPLWNYDRPLTRTASSYTPLIVGDLICSPNGFGGGLGAIKLTRENDEFTVTQLYLFKQSFDPFQDNTALVDDLLYTALVPDALACIEVKSGNVVWGAQAPVRGRKAFTYADGHLYLRHSNGMMTLAEATPRSYAEKGAFQIPGHETASGVTFPVVSGGRLYLRDNDRLHCYDISANALSSPHSEPLNVKITLSEEELDPGPLVTRPPRDGNDRAPDAVFVPTPHDVVDRMLELAEITANSVLIDLGSGDGRVVIAAAKKYRCRAVGFEIEKRLVDLSRDTIAKEQLESLARIEHTDLFSRDISGADVVTVFLYPHLMDRLIPQFEKLKPGSRIVSHQFEIPGVKPDIERFIESKETGDKHRILLWTTPLRRE